MKTPHTSQRESRFARDSLCPISEKIGAGTSIARQPGMLSQSIARFLPVSCVFVATLALVTACSDSSDDRYVAIEIRGVPSELPVGEYRRIFVDAVTDRGERTEVGRDVTWEVNDWEVVDMDDGADFEPYVIALAPGSATLTASYVDPSTESQLGVVFTITVVPAE